MPDQIFPPFPPSMPTPDQRNTVEFESEVMRGRKDGLYVYMGELLSREPNDQLCRNLKPGDKVRVKIEVEGIEG